MVSVVGYNLRQMQPSARLAIDTLTKLLEQISPDVLAYWVTPNTILSLSGARAYCDGVFYSDSKKTLNGWVDELNRSAQIIKSITDVYFIEAKIDKTNSGEPCASYDLVLEQGLEYVLHHTHLLPTRSIELISQQLSGEKLVDALAKLLSSQPAMLGYSRENLRHAAFGILVGYPDKAIIGSVSQWEHNDPFAEPLIDADIRGAGYYLCPQPLYTYPRHLVNDQDIRTNELLWSNILREFYTSDFHSKLANNPHFKRKAKQLGLYP